MHTALYYSLSILLSNNKKEILVLCKCSIKILLPDFIISSVGCAVHIFHVLHAYLSSEIHLGFSS